MGATLALKSKSTDMIAARIFLIIATISFVSGFVSVTDHDFTEEIVPEVQETEVQEATLQPFHKQPKSVKPVKSKMSGKQRKAILDLHNKLRSEVGQYVYSWPAADMRKLTWDKKLEASAQEYANKCIGFHSKWAGSKFGENIWGEGTSAKYAKSVKDVVAGAKQWYDEVHDISWKKNAKKVVGRPMEECNDTLSGKPICNVGHYYQFVWAKTSKVGCGIASCDKGMVQLDGTRVKQGSLLICRYDVPSRMGSKGESLGLPYTPGKKCSACSKKSCKDGLCTSKPHSVKADYSKIKQGKKKIPTLPAVKRAHVISKEKHLKYEKNKGKTCQLPAKPLNSHWVCKSKDGKQTVKPKDIGFFMYSIGYNKNIQCVAKCDSFNKGPLGTGMAIRYSQPKGRSAVADICNKAGKKLGYAKQAPKSLVKKGSWLRNFCKGIDECVLPKLKDKNAYFDKKSCKMSPSKPKATSGRYVAGSQCKVKCKKGYELDSRYGNKVSPCKFGGSIGGKKDDHRILGSIGPPTWTGGKYAIPPKCIKQVTAGFLSKLAEDKCKGKYNSTYKSKGCPDSCGTGISKQKIVTKCRIMAPYDNKYAPYIKKYCCCARADCYGKRKKKKKKKAVGGNLACPKYGKNRKNCGKNKGCKWDWLGSKCIYDCYQLKSKKSCTKDKGCSWRSWGRCGKDYGW